MAFHGQQPIDIKNVLKSHAAAVQAHTLSQIKLKKTNKKNSVVKTKKQRWDNIIVVSRTRMDKKQSASNGGWESKRSRLREWEVRRLVYLVSVLTCLQLLKGQPR